jgi:hypothetical protein
MNNINRPIDAQPITELAAVSSGTTGTPFAMNGAGSVSSWMPGETGMAATTVVLETAESASFSGTWQIEETLTHPGGNVALQVSTPMRAAWARYRVTSGGPLVTVKRQRWTN